jgi:hypothetical protein
MTITSISTTSNRICLHDLGINDLLCLGENITGGEGSSEVSRSWRTFAASREIRSDAPLLAVDAADRIRREVSVTIWSSP